MKRSSEPVSTISEDNKTPSLFSQNKWRLITVVEGGEVEVSDLALVADDLGNGDVDLADVVVLEDAEGAAPARLPRKCAVFGVALQRTRLRR
jgi:hypothetical protein